MNRTLIVGILSLFCGVASAEAPSLKCESGPARKSFGGSVWLVYACDDNRSVVAATESGPAFPFYFIFAHKDGAYQLYGEGTGNKAATEAANAELSRLKAEQIEALFKEASSKGKER